MDEIYPCPDAAERDTIIERTRLWLERAVIGLNLCPFAKSVFVKKQVRYALTAAATADKLLAELEQELALLAVRQDVTEEIDRLAAHVAAARALMDDEAPVGRRLDFLMQEFMREANTLCSKAQSLALTRVGLDLKTVIDQMREQIQNVE